MKPQKVPPWQIPGRDSGQNSEKGTILENPGISSDKTLEKVPS
jgi:hypothetical protein